MKNLAIAWALLLGAFLFGRSTAPTYQIEFTPGECYDVLPEKAPQTPQERQDSLIIHYSEQAGIPDSMVKAVIEQESGGDPAAINHADPSYGLGQIMPRWWRHAFVEECGDEATPETLMRDDLNICYTAHILGYLNERYKGNPTQIFSYYNTGSPSRGEQYAEAVQRRLSLMD